MTTHLRIDWRRATVSVHQPGRGPFEERSDGTEPNRICAPSGANFSATPHGKLAMSKSPNQLVRRRPTDLKVNPLGRGAIDGQWDLTTSSH